jgi:predicted restriction endonuclease
MISEFYQQKLSHLNVDRSSGHPKPHKVCLLLSALNLIASGRITRNVFRLDDELKREFGTHFKRLKKGNDAEKIIQPFYHLHTEGIWHFEVKPGKHAELEALKAKGGTPSEKVLFEVIEYAYLDETLFGYLQDDFACDVIKQLLLANLEDMSDQFHRWLLSIGKSERTANSYVGAVSGTISDWASDAGITPGNLIGIQSYSEIHRIAEELTEYRVFQERNTRGKQMYSSALNSYQAFLSDACQAEVTEDIQQIIEDDSLDNTEKSRLVSTRVGQGKFREDLIRYWKGCALTGYEATGILIASHIKPWREAGPRERLDHYNGLLLLPNLDKAFDLGYISFVESGGIIISDHIEAPDALGIDRSMRVHLAMQHQDYMAFHREHEFKR